MENRTAFMEYQETVINLKSSKEHKETITQQHQEAVQIISFGIQWRSMECKVAIREYQEAFMQYEETFYGIPRSFYGIPNYQEALSNTMKLDGISRGFDENLV